MSNSKLLLSDPDRDVLVLLFLLVLLVVNLKPLEDIFFDDPSILGRLELKRMARVLRLGSLIRCHFFDEVKLFGSFTEW